MIIIKGDDVDEISALLEQLGIENSLLKEQEDTIKKRRTTINKQVKDFAEKLGGNADRVILPAGDEMWWDRRVSGGNGTLSLDLLRELFGDRVVNKICDKVVTYQLSSEKLASACRRGIITEEDLALATVKGTPTYSLYCIPAKDLPEEDDEG